MDCTPIPSDVELIRRVRVIEQAGLLGELEYRVAIEWRHSRGRDEVNPYLKIDAESLAQATGRLLGRPSASFRSAAVEALSRASRRSVVEKVVAEVYAEVVGKKQAAPEAARAGTTEQSIAELNAKKLKSERRRS